MEALTEAFNMLIAACRMRFGIIELDMRDNIIVDIHCRFHFQNEDNVAQLVDERTLLDADVLRIDVAHALRGFGRPSARWVIKVADRQWRSMDCERLPA